MNEETKYALNIIVSMIPVGIVGLFFKDKVEEAFGSGLLIVGVMLLVTSVLLTFSYFAKPRPKECQAPSQGAYLNVGCFRDWHRSGMCRAARTLPFWLNDSHGLNAR